ncbi:primosomal replication protein N [Mycobacterium dioxanotrophicus]|uniref:Primosomal replication protein N n=1 Tax=Mycobacterium dioxanotrophicus TaxID=482462 RepID=A0A1Y0C1V7_9MYCO|nr:HK97 family phage prohead protease [Mycobacterium dioxanotrophicus]ART69114.1 primosomal replication protein N [Mycobacterium dioxanotrophicus]
MTQKTPPRDDVCRSVPFTLTRDGEADGDGLSFEGYGAVFNSPTRIDSWEGVFDEQIAPGAFRKSLRERTPKFQFDHGHHPLIGSVPIGTITDIHEDDRGLYVAARLGQHIVIDLIREAIASGAIDGMSFRFSVVRDEWQDNAGKAIKDDSELNRLLYGEEPERLPLLRTLKEVKIAEVGPVVWPAYSDTTASVRSTDEEPVVLYRSRLKEPEQRRLLAEMLLRADAVDTPEEGDSSNDEPQDTAPVVAVEHSGQDDDTPRSTEQAGEHESEPVTEAPPTDEVDEARAAALEQVFADALNEVKNTRDATPPLKGI